MISLNTTLYLIEISIQSNFNLSIQINIITLPTGTNSELHCYVWWMNRPVISYKIWFICCTIHIQGSYWELNVDNIVVPFFITNLKNRRKGKKILPSFMNKVWEMIIQNKWILLYFKLERTFMVLLHFYVYSIQYLFQNSFLHKKCKYIYDLIKCCVI